MDGSLVSFVGGKALKLCSYGLSRKYQLGTNSAFQERMYTTPMHGRYPNCNKIFRIAVRTYE